MELASIWFFLWGLLWAVYFMLDGFDLGIGSLLPFLAKTEKDRRVMTGAMGPYWDGNEVWLISAGGVMFAAFPTAYAVMFSSMYSALLLLLFGLIFRGVSMEFRTKVDSARWRAVWDHCLFAGSALPAVLLGVAFANIFQGIPFDKDGVYHGTLLTLLNPYGLLGGALFLLLFLVHGALWLTIKTEGALQSRAGRAAGAMWIPLLAVAVAFLAASKVYTPLYNNYFNHPALFVIPAAAVAGLVLTRIFISSASWWKAWIASAVTIVSATFFGVTGLYPNLFPSSLNPAWSLNVTNASSSQLTLKLMLGVTLVMVPVVIAYQVWTFVFFKDKSTGYGEY